MNRLKYSKFYLAGPMDACRDEGREWRDELTPFLENLGIVVLNPYNKPILDECGLEDDINHSLVQQALSRKDYDEVTRLMKNIRQVDLRMTDHADAIIVNLDLTKRPCGTWEEIFTANRAKKPVIVKCDKKEELPPWIFSVIPHQLFFESWNEVEKYIKHVNEDIYVDKLGRWVFFDLESQINQINKSSISEYLEEVSKEIKYFAN